MQQKHKQRIQRLQEAKFQLHKRKKTMVHYKGGQTQEQFFQRSFVISNLGDIQNPKQPDLFDSFVTIELD